MNKIRILIAVFSTIVFTAPAFSEQQNNEQALKAEANLIVKQFGGQLKPKLIAAIQSGGLEHAIDFCSVESPKIATELSKQTGWTIKRVSLKARNKSTATPDEFEKNTLTQFDDRQKNGEQPSSIYYGAVVDGSYRFMRAQGVGAICLSCHGDAVSTDVKKALNKHYPDDVATGYSLGQVRGAFSLSKALNQH